MMDPMELCDAMRQLASCAVDGELSELERFRLDRHLLGCAECAGFARHAYGLSLALRSAELESVELPELPLPVVLDPRRRRVAAPTRRLARPVRSVARPVRRVGAVVATVGLVLGAGALGIATGIGRDEGATVIGGPSVTAQGHRLVVEDGLVGWRPAMPLGQRNALEDF